MNIRMMVYAAIILAVAGSMTGATTPDVNVAAPPAFTTALPRTCAFVAIMADDTVIIDWQCVSLQAAEYKARRDRSTSSALAFALEALRNGTAIVK